MKRFMVLVMVLALVAGFAGLAEAQRGRNLTPEQIAEHQRELERELASPRPIEMLDSVWIEELTWMEVRDLLKAGKTTAIIPTGGIEQNGPYLALGKHNYVLQTACEDIARELGNALCAPIISLVPEGDHNPPTGHMRYPGTISMRQETFRMLLDDVASSLKAHGFEHIVFIGDSGGNQGGMEETAKALNERWGQPIAHYIPEFYRYAETTEYMNRELGITEPMNEGIHDDFVITSLMMIVDPTTVRYDQRVAAGKATINGVSIVPKEKTIETAKKLMKFRVDNTVKAIKSAIGTASSNR